MQRMSFADFPPSLLSEHVDTSCLSVGFVYWELSGAIICFCINYYIAHNSFAELPFIVLFLHFMLCFSCKSRNIHTAKETLSPPHLQVTWYTRFFCFVCGKLALLALDNTLLMTYYIFSCDTVLKKIKQQPSSWLLLFFLEKRLQMRFHSHLFAVVFTLQHYSSNLHFENILKI